MKSGSLWVLGLILVGLVLTVGAFLSNATPYLTVAEAKQTGRSAHVALTPVPSSIQFDLKTMTLRFEGKDKTGTMTVVYPKGKPNNFEAATQVVVVGEYKEGVFQAREILVKCPSKYQGEQGAR